MTEGLVKSHKVYLLEEELLRLDQEKDRLLAQVRRIEQKEREIEDKIISILRDLR
jgi:uncharacterized membrane protein YobD (UPF0266 family)